ncbi:MAG: KamA family radical SAM protein [Candidatus Bathyarchaeota archaeon]|nr:KamA family radical SAM protein [Candidatus Bathyarchaeota archaeon]
MLVEYKKLEDSLLPLHKLKDYLHLSFGELEQLKKIVQIHPMRVNAYYLSLINWNDPKDPIKQMAIPSLDELNLEGFYDTSGEAENTKMVGLQHKYAETVLILATNRCAMYCRHCFRKRLAGLPSEEILSRFEDAAEYISNHEEINNVLISGGDPLVLSNELIERFLKTLMEIDHIDFIRFGSRIPVTLPSRLNDLDLLALFKKYSRLDKRIYVITQFNHPREITPQSICAINNLLKSGVLVNNQAVLLRNVNDDPFVLSKLLKEMVRIGVLPYYVFQCRPVKRVKYHFQTPIFKGIQIVETAKTNCDGLSKRFKYIMSHKTGKIEILGIMKGDIYFKYHQAKERKNLGRIFKRKISKKAGWLDDFQ